MMPAAASELLAFVVEMAMLPVHLCLIQPDAVHLLSPVDRNVCHASQGAPDQLSAEDLSFTCRKSSFKAKSTKQTFVIL